MQALRRRIPFSFADDTDEDQRVLDEQEQDELIHQLRSQAHATNAQSILIARFLLTLSIIIHLIHALTQSAPTLFAVLSLMIHLNLYLYILPPLVRKGSTEYHLPSPLPFGLTFSLSAVAPTLCLFIGHSWQTILWWCITPAMVFAIRTVKTAVCEVNEDISKLERLKYHAPGA